MELFRPIVDSISPRFDDEVDGTIIKGAIDYILLPLTILAVSGPIFVVMYIVMASVEFRLNPNIQAGRSSSSSSSSLVEDEGFLLKMFGERAKQVVQWLSSN